MDPTRRTPVKDRLAMQFTHPETPYQLKISQAAASAPGNLGTVAKRENMLLDLGQSVPQIPIEWFTDANGILPPLKEGINFEKVIENLIKEKVLVQGKIPPEGYWSSFPTDPRDHPDVENIVFRPVQNIADAIRKAAGMKSPTLVFRCNPDMSPDSSTRPDNKTKPDAYGVLADPQIDPKSGGKPRWIDVAVPGELKKSTSSNQDVDVSSFIFGFSFFASVLLGHGLPTDGL